MLKRFSGPCSDGVYLLIFFFFHKVPPRFTRVPDRAVAVRESSTAIVRCEAFGFPPPEIHWSKAFSQLPQRRSRVTNGTLQISQFSVQDIGSYQCKATNRLGSVITTTTLHFQGPPGERSVVNLLFVETKIMHWLRTICNTSARTE